MGNKQPRVAAPPSATNNARSLLINGYIRHIQTHLSRAISADIISLCNDFFGSRIILIYLDQGNFHDEPFELRVTDFFDKSRKYKANLRRIRHFPYKAPAPSNSTPPIASMSSMPLRTNAMRHATQLNVILNASIFLAKTSLSLHTLSTSCTFIGARSSTCSSASAATSSAFRQSGATR